MSILNGCRESVDRAGHRASPVGWGCVAACLLGLMGSVAWNRIETATAADALRTATLSGGTVTLDNAATGAGGTMASDDADFEAGIPARRSLKPTIRTSGSGTLILSGSNRLRGSRSSGTGRRKSNSMAWLRKPRSPEDYQKIVAESLYPPTDSPQELTLEQLEAIAKLAPKIERGRHASPSGDRPAVSQHDIELHRGNVPKRSDPLSASHSGALPTGQKVSDGCLAARAGECGSDNINQLSHLHHIIPSLVGPKKRDFFLLVPQCPHRTCLGSTRDLLDEGSRRRQPPVSHRSMIRSPWRCSDRLHACHDRGGEERVSGRSEPRHRGGPQHRRRWHVADFGAASGPFRRRRADRQLATVQDKSLREKPLLKKIPIWAIYSSDDRRSIPPGKSLNGSETAVATSIRPSSAFADIEHGRRRCCKATFSDGSFHERRMAIGFLPPSLRRRRPKRSAFSPT